MKSTKLLISTLFVAGCGGAKSPPHAPETQPMPAAQPAQTGPMAMTPTEAPDVTEARAKFPRLIDLHAGVIARTCSPNPGVCHQTNNYPDMHTAGNFLSLVNAPCNVQIPDPKQGWDSCEQKGDKIRLGDQLSDVAWLEKKSSGKWHVAFRDVAASSEAQPLEIFTPSHDSVFVPPIEWKVTLTPVAGTKEGEIDVGMNDPYIMDFSDSVLARAVGGDPNRNGVWGADDPHVAKGALISPANRANSYLWGRITATVPGTRMPLANKPLSNSEYVALACWIEGIDPRAALGVEDAIDYDGCAFAKNPTRYADQ
jgi:hypothetical protein